MIHRVVFRGGDILKKANDYVFRELLHVIEDAEAGEIKKTFEKYMRRYDSDPPLLQVGCRVLGCSGNIKNGDMTEIQTQLRGLMNSRRIKRVRGARRILPTHLTYR